MNHYEIKIKEKTSHTAWEDLLPVQVFSSGTWEDAIKEYVDMFIRENVDLSNVWEYRCNIHGSPQGHYFNPNWQTFKAQRGDYNDFKYTGYY